MRFGLCLCDFFLSMMTCQRKMRIGRGGWGRGGGGGGRGCGIRVGQRTGGGQGHSLWDLRPCVYFLEAQICHDKHVLGSSEINKMTFFVHMKNFWWFSFLFFVRNQFRCGIDSWRHRFHVKELKISECPCVLIHMLRGGAPLFVNTFPTHKQYGSCRPEGEKWIPA